MNSGSVQVRPVPSRPVEVGPHGPGATLRRVLETVVETVPGALGLEVALVADVVRPVAAIGTAPSGPVTREETRDGLREVAAHREQPGAEPAREAAVRARLTGRPVLLTPAEILPRGWGHDQRDGEAEVEAEVRGAVAVPLLEDAGLPLVVTAYLDRPARQEDAERLAQAGRLLTGVVTVVERCTRAEARADQMVQMVQYRRVIEQAKGMVMAVTGASAETAFATLARGSQHFNVRLRNLAVALVELVGGAPAEGPEDPSAVITPSPQDRLAAERIWAALTAPRAAGAGSP